LHIETIRAIGRLNATTIEEEPDGVGGFALPLTESVHQLLQGCCALDLEEDLVIVIGHLYVEMLTGIAFRLLGGTRAAVLIRSRHSGGR